VGQTKGKDSIARIYYVIKEKPGEKNFRGRSAQWGRENSERPPSHRGKDSKNIRKENRETRKGKGKKEKKKGERTIAPVGGEPILKIR